MSTIKNGKKPLSSKPTTILRDEDVFGRAMDIPEDIRRELEEKGLEPHWLDAQSVYQGGGYHRRGWVPYVRKTSDSATMTSSEFKLGRDPEGLVRYGSLILGVKTKENVAKHKALLAQKANRGREFQREKARELRQLAKEANLDSMKIHEGFEENED